MPDLNFSVESAEPVTYAASPMLSFRLRIANSDPEEKIQSVALRCQIQIETTLRRYSRGEQAQLYDLFGEPERWSRTLRSILWTHVSAMVPSFQGETVIALPVPCTFDFNVAATKYFAGLSEGVVPLDLMFSGSIFFENPDYGLQVTQISWNKEARFRLPIVVWQDMMEHYYPNTVWLCLRRDVFKRLARYKSEQGIPTWEQALESILPNQPKSVEDDEIKIEGSLPS
jgi:hypothetical protein